MKHKAAFQLEKHGARVVYRLPWSEVRRILGRDHANTAADDQKLVRALRAAGARPLAKSYSKEDGWHAFAPKGTPAPEVTKRSNPTLSRRMHEARRARPRTMLAEPHRPSKRQGPKACRKCGQVHTIREHASHRNVAAKFVTSEKLKIRAKRRPKARKRAKPSR